MFGTYQWIDVLKNQIWNILWLAGMMHRVHKVVAL